MKFSVGDIVKVRKTGEEGKVVEMDTDGYLRVKLNGIIFPISEKELDFPYLDWFLKAREENKKQKLYVDNLKVEKRKDKGALHAFGNGFYLIFRPIYREVEMEDLIHRFEIYAYNEMPVAYSFLVDITIPQKHLFSYEGSVAAGQQMLLFSIPFDEATDNPTFSFEFTPEEKSGNRHSLRKMVKLGRKFLIEKVHLLQTENRPLFELKIFDDKQEIEKIELPVFRKISSPFTNLGTPRTLEKAREEIDIHIEKIYSQYHLLSVAEILQFQLDYFTYYLDLALADKSINPLRVVHGIGDGILTKAINKICKQHIGVDNYKYEGYNPGVTLVYFKNNL